MRVKYFFYCAISIFIFSTSLLSEIHRKINGSLTAYYDDESRIVAAYYADNSNYYAYKKMKKGGNKNLKNARQTYICLEHEYMEQERREYRIHEHFSDDFISYHDEYNKITAIYNIKLGRYFARNLKGTYFSDDKAEYFYIQFESRYQLQNGHNN